MYTLAEKYGLKIAEKLTIKAKPKVTKKPKPVDKEKTEFVFRTNTNKYEKEFQKVMIDYFKDQEKEALSVISKSYFPFDSIEEHILMPSIGLTRVFPRKKKVVQKGKSNESQEMKDLFEKRTKLHIKLVQKYVQKVIDLEDKRLDKDLLKKELVHDQSKFEEPEYTPYLHVNWHYHLKDKGEEYTPSEEIKNQMDKATFHHVKNNKHHPEYWDKSSTGDVINRNDRDKTPEKMVDATKMPLDYIASMVADWLAMSEEKKTDPFDWAKKMVNKRWKFTKAQVRLIDDLLGALAITKITVVGKKEIGLSTIFKASPNALPDRFDFSGWSYKDSKWNKRLQKEGGLFIKKVYDKEGRRVWDDLAYRIEGGLEGAFDIDNPLVQEFLEDYAFTFAQGINDTTVGSLQAAMSVGMEEGLGMDGIAKLVRDVFDNCSKYRSLLIARTETIRASNGAARMAYEQSGVVEGMEWLVTRDDRTCPFCMSMSGKIIGLDEVFFDLGDKLTVGAGKDKSTIVFDYEAVEHPPLHPNCRCTVIPRIYEEYQLPKSIGLRVFLKGGPGSGNYGHVGRRGQVGGSGGGTGTSPSLRGSSTDVNVVGQATVAAMKELNITDTDIESVVKVEGWSSKCKVDVERGTVVVNNTWKDKDGEDVGSMIFTLPIPSKNKEETGKAFFDYLTISADGQGKSVGSDVMRRSEDLFRKAGMTEVALLADISIGTYSWAKAGYDYSMKDTLTESKALLRNYVLDTSKNFGVKFSKERKVEIDKQIASCKSARDIAVFAIPELKAKVSKYKRLGDFENEDVPGKLVVDIGKAFMLADGAHGQWNGVKKLR
uniref:Putative capsid morphogenesis protein n=1 Tax=viral metagenome TaxID=1070528 RepID=A0A6M3K349_9ZZZZ